MDQRIQTAKSSPSPLEEDPGRRAMQRLLESVRESGVLHIVDSLFGKLGALSEAVLDRLDNEPAQGALSRVALAFDHLAALRTSVSASKALPTSAGKTSTDETSLARSEEGERPGLLGLLDILNHPDTRRGVLALLIALRKLGETVREAPDHP